jgi:hypothetical protein
MHSEIDKRSMPDGEAREVDPAKIAGGTDCAPADLVPDATALYDTMVDATSAVIERVMTTAKTF